MKVDAAVPVRRHVLCAALAHVSLAAVCIAQDVTDSLLNRPARLAIQSATLEQALPALASRSGVLIAFSPDLMPARRVSCRCANVTVREALDSLLAGTALEYRSTGTQVLIVVRRERSLEGFVRTEDGSPVSQATVGVVGGSLTVTGEDGGFRMRIPLDSVRLFVERLGIESDTLMVPPDQDVISLRVTPRLINLDPLVGRAERLADLTRFESAAQTSTMTFDIETITRMPGIAEADIVRAVQAMPGTVTKNDFSTGYNVRGGESDQNLILLDGITVINPVHLGGAFSTFDANAVDRVTFMSGGFPAHYSSRLSSVLDLRVRSDAQKFGGQGQLSLLSSKMMLTGPIGDGSYLVSARRTYADHLVAAFTRHELPYYFTDVLGKASVPLGERSTLAATAYWGRDVLDYRLAEPTDVDSIPIDLKFNWGNRLAGLTWTRAVGDGTLETRASVSEFSTTLGLFPDLAKFHNHVRLVSVGTKFGTAIGSASRVDVGTGVERIAARYEVDSPTIETSLGDLDDAPFVPVFNRRYEPTVWSAFVDYQWSVANKFLFRPGFRVEYTTGADFWALAPRVSAKVFLTERQAVIGSVGRYYQALHSLRDRDLPITFFEFWIGASATVPVARSDHVVLGYERWFGESLQLLVEGYRKIYHDLVIPNRALSLRDDGDEFLPMSGHSWGFDLIVRKHFGDVRGWLGYGFNRSEREVNEETFPPSHDRRHTVNVVLEAPGPLGSEMGVRWAYGAPLPFSSFQGEWDHLRYSPISQTYSYLNREPISLGINDARYPSYQRLDVSFRWTLYGLGIEWHPYFQVANVYNRRNVFLYSFDYSLSPPRRTSISQIPIFPTFGLEFKW